MYNRINFILNRKKRTYFPITQSLNIDPRGERGSRIVLRSRSKEIANSTYIFFDVISLHFVQDCSFNIGGGADIECHQKSLAFKHIPSEQLRSQDRIFGGETGLHLGWR